MRLFRWFILRRLVHEPLRSATTTLGIALGVAVVIAIQVTNASSFAGFETALDTVSGRTSLEIVGPAAAVREDQLTGLTWLREYGEMAPVIEGDVLFVREGRPAETLRVLGVDLLRDEPFRDYELTAIPAEPSSTRVGNTLLDLLLDPGSALLAEKFATPAGLSVGSTFTVGFGDHTVTLTVRALLKDEGPARVLDGHFVLMDIAAAQRAIGRPGHITRLDLRLPPSTAVDDVAAAIAARLPSGLTVQRPSQRGRQIEQMLAAFHANLTALSYVALIVGLFLVYNTVSVAVLARREEIGALRALGVTRAEVRRLFLGEAAVLALAGCAAGLGLGRVMADFAVALTSTTVSALYIASAAAPPALEWRHVLLAFGIGVPLSLVAAVVPAQEAANVPPVAAIRGADRLATRSGPPRQSFATGLALLALAALLSTAGPVGGLPLFGYGAALATVFGAACLVPLVLYATARRFIEPARRLLRVEDWLAVTNVAAAVPRLSISVAALAVSLAMMVAIAILIGSFRETVVYWVGQTLQADLFVSPGTRPPGGANETLSPELVALISSHPSVAAVDRFRRTEVPYANTVIRVGAGDFATILDHGTLAFKAPGDARERMRTAIGTDAIVVSESFSLKQRVGPDDHVELPTAGGPHRFRVAAVYYDYSSDRGVVMMDRATFIEQYRDDAISGVSVYLRQNVDEEQARTALLETIGDRYRVFINTNRSLRAEVLRIFDSTFAITYALEVVAILVAVLGVAGTLLTLVLERERELVILRLIGTGARQIRRMVVGEAVLLGVVSQALGLAVGFLLSLLIIYVINVQSFGWTIQFHLPLGFLGQASLALVAAAACAGLYPAHRAARLVLRREE